jgi:uncharacterized glyoxalase superfamily protein PhnB
VTSDPFEQLRVDDEPARPEPGFVARLRARVAAALDLTADLPTIQLPERNTTMTDTAATPRATSTLTTYICVSPAADAIAWYGDVFGAVETIRYTADDGRVGHAELDIAGAHVMLSDEYPELDVRAPTSLGGTPVTLHLEVPDVDATYERVVAAGARVAGAPKDEAYGARSFTMVDPFGHRWMVQTPLGTPSIEELQSRVEGFTITAPTTAAPTRPVVELGYFTLALPDTVAAGRFYGELFGWTTEPGNSGAEYAHVNNTKLPLGFTPGPADEPPVLYFRVDDIAAYEARVAELGGTVLSETTYDSGPNAVCVDDQGRRFELWQPAPGY